MRKLKNSTFSSPIKVLVVEDEPGNVEFISEMLRKAKYAIFEPVPSFRVSKGLERLTAGDIDAVLLGFSIKDGDVIGMFRRFNKQAPDLPVLVLSDRGNEALAVEAIRAGAEDYLVKEHIEGDILARAICLAVVRKSIKEALRKTTIELKRSVMELEKTNQKVLERQESIAEEEKLKVMIEMAGAAAHEVKQPLTALLGNIELIKMLEDIPPELDGYISGIKGAGEKISESVSKIREIHANENKPRAVEGSKPEFNRHVNVLSVEDSDQDFGDIETSLKKAGTINLIRAHTIDEAMKALKLSRVDVILLDYVLPDGNGLDFMSRIKTYGKDVPIIVITGQGDEMIASRVIQAGAFDYFPKRMISAESLSRSISNTLEKARLKRKVIQVQKRLAEMSIKDDLTELYNRRYFTESLRKEIARAGRLNTELVLCMLDLDYFKRVNDTYGHPTGDMVLTQIGNMLRESIRLNDYCCRYGGEEFAVILPNTSLGKARTVCERFRELVAGHRFNFNSEQFRITISIGIAHWDGLTDQTAVEMVAAADQALYRAKRKGRNRVKEEVI